jgi:hypothetical protein
VGLAIASLLLTGACRREGAEVTPLPDSFTTFELSARRDVDAGGTTAHAAPVSARGDSPIPALLTVQPLSPELRALVERGHAHPAVGSLEAAGCDLALVMTGADDARFFDLRRAAKYGKMEPVAFDRQRQVVWCQTLTTPVDCVALAPIFARVARPKHQFTVYSGSSDPPFNPRCVGTHNRKGKYLSGEGPGYPSTARL